MTAAASAPRPDHRAGELAVRTDVELRLDPSRVLAQLFVPGQELAHETESRASGVLSRVLAFDDATVSATLADVLDRFTGRHRDLTAILLSHYERVSHRVSSPSSVSEERRLLIGACFTSEYATEAAALFNPSAVPHPDQSGLAPGQVRFVLSLRAAGEGHISSIEFRTGVAGPGRALRVEAPSGFVEQGEHRPALFDRELFRNKLTDEGSDSESTSFLLRKLPPRFDHVALEKALHDLAGQRVTRAGGAHTDQLARIIAESNYDVVFGEQTPLDERVLWPYSQPERHGMEDARFVRFVDDDGTVSYLATYTAFDGAEIAPQIIETFDFCRFRISQLSGPAAKNKGMAVFPRKVNGRFVALSRWDRESNAITTSLDGHTWGEPTNLQSPERPWELIQLGNSGSPIETSAGWLVLTHGVGPLREYSLGAVLLDLDDPTRVLASLREPLLRPAADERNGYVPNVVYSCGSLLVGDQLLIPYGVSDSSIRFAYVDVPELLDRLAADAAATRANSAS
jgi:predicted GH43/DUF377 family glycosyl hydrolase